MPPNDVSIPRFGARSKAKELAEEAESLRMEVARPLLVEQRSQVAQRLAELQQEVVVTEEMALLQDVGVYEYRHPLDDAVSYQAELLRLKDAIRTATRRDGGAVRATTGWTVNGSLTEGGKMVRDFSKLLLRAYNAEADNLVRGLKPYKLESAIDRLTKVAVTIAKLGSTMDIAIAEPYHQLRIKELELTADHAERLAEEKEREREEKTRLREERQAQLEFERERAKLEKEQAHYENAMRALLAKNDDVGAAALRERLDERVNLVNRRREFFYVTPAEVRDHLAALSGDLLEFQDIPETLEYHQSENERSTSGRVSGQVLR